MRKRLQKKVLNKACMYIKISLACVQSQESEKNLEFIFIYWFTYKISCGKTLLTTVKGRFLHVQASSLIFFHY